MGLDPGARLICARDFESSELVAIDPVTNDGDQEEDGLSVLLGEIATQMVAYDSSGDVRGALGYLIQQLDLMEITFGLMDSRLLSRLESYRTAYQQQVLQKAMDAFTKGGNKRAINLLYEAPGLLGAENE